MINTCVKSYRSLMFYDLFGSAVDEIMRNNLGSIYLVANVWLLWPGSGWKNDVSPRFIYSVAHLAHKAH